MKVAITGHTSGLGKAFKECFESHNHEVVGFSLSSGHDITSYDVVNEIVKVSTECDVFINNAWAPRAQLFLLQQMLEHYAYTDKVIINVGSKVTFEVKGHATSFPKEHNGVDLNAYFNDKKILQEFADSAVFNAKCKLINLRPGAIDTPMSANSPAIIKMMDAKEIAELVYYLYNIRDKILVHDILFDRAYF